MLRALSLAALALLATLLTACGGEAADGEADPATAVPADAPVYVEVAVRPDGALREDTLAAAGRVLRTDDPEGRIRELVDQAFAESDEEVDYDRDIEPWLGERVGLWANAPAGAAEQPPFVALMATTDTELALDSLERTDREGAFSTERSYRDTTYRLDEGFAYGAVGDFIAFGREPELKRTIDALEGDSLAESARYRESVGQFGDDRLGRFFVDTNTLFELGSRQDGSTEDFRRFREMLGLEELPPVAGAFAADGERLALDVSLAAEGDALDRLGALTGSAGSTPLLEELPGDAWLAGGAADYGETLRTLFDQLAGAFGGAVAEEQFRQQTGLDLQEDVFSWIGDVAYFVRGETPQTLDGGVVIEVTDEQRAADAFGKLVGVIRTQGAADARPVRIEGADTAFAISDAATPQPVILARGQGRVVAAYGEDAAAQALAADEPLADSELHSRGEAILGHDVSPTVLVSMPAILRLVDASPGAADPEWAQVRPYLEAYDVVAGGGGREGEQVRGRVAAGLVE
jgi:hypothetical protein